MNYSFSNITISVIILLLFSSATARSQNSILLKDISPGNGSSAPSGFIELNGKTIFSASDPNFNTELFISDGTPSGTYLLKDINAVGGSFPSNLTVYNGKAYFTANDGVNGSELWTTDGTAAGTKMFLDIYPGFGGSTPTSLFIFNNRLFFVANNFTNGSEIWTSDGTAAGTFLFKDINSAGNSSPSLFTVLNNYFFFRANDGVNGIELWKSDGSLGGTQMVKDITPGINSTTINAMIAYKDSIFFSCSAGTTGNELWVSNGTSSGTLLFKDIYLGLGSSSPTSFYKFKDKLFFNASTLAEGGELWICDGTDAGTYLFKSIRPGNIGSLPSSFFEFNGKLYFNANNGTEGIELWATDTSFGTAAMVKDINPGLSNSNPSNFVVYNSEMFFIAQSISGTDVYRLNVLDSINLVLPYPNIPINTFHNAQNLRLCNNSLYFSGNYTVENSEPYIINNNPKLFVSADLTNSFYAFVDSISNPESFTLMGFSLTDSITLKISGLFEFAGKLSGPYTNKLTFYKGANGNISTNFYVRFKPITKGASLGMISAIIIGVDTAKLGVFGYGLSIPSMQSSTLIADTFISFVDSISSVKFFNVSGKKLNSDIKVKAPAYFKVSLDSIDNFSDSIKLSLVGDSVTSTKVYVRFYPNKKGIVSDKLLIESLGHATLNTSVKGLGIQNSFFKVINWPSDTLIADVNKKSIAYSFIIYGEELSNGLTLEANKYFEFSNDSIDFSGKISLTPNNKLLDSVKVFVRFYANTAGVKEEVVQFYTNSVDTLKKGIIGKANPEVISSIAGINSNFSVYPNPFFNTIYFKENASKLDAVSCVITDLCGKAVIIYASGINNSIDVTHLPKGVYYMTLYNKVLRETFKLVKSAD